MLPGEGAASLEQCQRGPDYACLAFARCLLPQPGDEVRRRAASICPDPPPLRDSVSLTAGFALSRPAMLERVVPYRS